MYAIDGSGFRLLSITFAPMSKPILTLCLILLTYCAYAQDGYPEDRTFSGSLVFGANASQVDGDSYYGYHKLGLHTGAGVSARFTDEFGAGMELLYTRKGSVGQTIIESPTIGTYVYKYFMKLNYVEVPFTIHFRYKIVEIEAGISYSRLIKADEWVEADRPVYIDPIKNRYNTNDVDYLFGVSRQVYKKLFVNVRYQYSITSIRPADRIPYGYGYGNKGQFNNLFNFRLVYIL